MLSPPAAQLMALMARLPWSIRSGAAALQRAAGCGEHTIGISSCSRIPRPSTRALQSRGIATNAAIQERGVDFPGGVPPASAPQPTKKPDRRQAIKNAKPFSDFLTDTFNRQHDYLRISVTERCNLRCLYCMPQEGIPLSPNANMLTTPEIFYLSSLFVSQGVTKIRLTGGEPTVRRDIVPLMHQIGSLRPRGLRELALTTNGISLHRKLDAMVEAGLTGINLSLDTLDPFQFQIMTRRKGFDAVIKSVDRILEMNRLGAGVKLKVNCVVMRGLNEREIIPFVEMGREKDIEVRFIEYMPFGGNKWSEGKMISFQEMLDIIRVKYPDLRAVPGHKNDTSKTFEVPGFVGKVGFITSMTNDFCSSCNRLRITSDGNLKVCLHGMAEVSLRHLLRQGNNGEPIDQEAFERIRQFEMDHNEGRISDETPLGWGQREHDLLDLIGKAVKRKEEKHADLNELAKMDNRPMILIDEDTPVTRMHLSSQSPPAHITMTSVGRYTTQWTNSMPSAPFTHLYSPVSQRSSLRAYSTTSDPLTTKDQDQDQVVATNYGGDSPNATISDEIEEFDFFDTLNIKDILGVPIADALKHVRNKHKLSGPEYNDYWRYVIENQLMTVDENDSINAGAAHMLAEIDAGNSENRAERNPLTKHAKLMKRVRKHADAVSQTQETERITSSRRDALTGLLTEMEMPTSGLLVEELERKISDLENRIAVEGANYALLASSTSERLPSNKSMSQKLRPERAARRSKLIARRQLIREHFSDVDISPSAAVLLEIVARKFYAAEDQFSAIGSDCSAQDVQLWQTLRKEVVQNLRAALELPNGAKKLFKQERKRIIERMDMAQAEAEVGTATAGSGTEPAEAPKSAKVEEIEMPAAMNDELEELKNTIQTYRQELALLKATVSDHYQKMRKVRRKKQELHAKRQDLLKQLDEQEKIAQQAKFALRPKRLVKIPRSEMRTDLDDILDDALARIPQSGGMAAHDDSGSLKEGPVHHRLGFEAAKELNAVTKRKEHDTTKDNLLADNEPHTTMVDTRAATKSPAQSPTDLLSKSSTTSPTTSQPSLFQTTTTDILPPSDRKAGSTLRLQIPASNTIPIDSTLTVNFSAPIPSLQIQVYEMQQRLRSSYPRIDTLPYEVWTSENKRTLHTWLKILVSRWQTRFDDVGGDTKGNGEANALDEQVKAVLDQMVRDHDLSNEAAERMAMHWHEVLTHRGSMDGDAEGVLDWEEFDAGGFGFMAMKEEVGDIATQEGNEGVGAQDTGSKTMAFGTTGMRGFEGVARRLYSTCTRPPREAASTHSTSTEDADAATHANPNPTSSSTTPIPISTPATQSSSTSVPGPFLPHLTPTGSAHMVSVSSKPDTHRTATAIGTVHFSNPTPLTLIRSARVKKGDVLSVSRIAGILAAKKCPDLIPLCHPIALTHVGVELRVFGGAGPQEDAHGAQGQGGQDVGGAFGGVAIEATVECKGPTGVEMEALTAVVGAALSVVDMCKAVDKAQCIGGVRVVRKEWGRGGRWVEEGWGGSSV